MSSESHRIAAFGKLPWAGDFVQHGVSPSVEMLLSWVEQGIAVGGARGTPWRESFTNSAQKAFVMPLGNGGFASGVMAPSQDEVGRKFPFLVLSEAELSAVARAPHVLPLVLGTFLQGSGVAIAELMNGRYRSLGDAMAPIGSLQLAALDGHNESYSSWVQAAPLRAVGQAIFGGGWRESLAHALYVCVESIRPFFGVEPPPTPLAVRLPVGAGFGGAAAFWLHVVRVAGGWRDYVPACFWSFEPNGASITIFLGNVQPSAFADLWEAHPDSDSLSDLTTGSATLADYLRGTNPRLADVVEREDSVVVDLIQALLP